MVGVFVFYPAGGLPGVVPCTEFSAKAWGEEWAGAGGVVSGKGYWGEEGRALPPYNHKEGKA